MPCGRSCVHLLGLHVQPTNSHGAMRSHQSTYLGYFRKLSKISTSRTNVHQAGSVFNMRLMARYIRKQAPEE